MSGYCDRCGNTMCVCSEYEAKTADYELHESTKQPNWQTKIVCECGEQCSNWMEFYRHRGDAYRDQLALSHNEGDAWGRARPPGPGEPGDASDAT